MKSSPFISIAVITYNQEKYIAQTLDSIIEQEHGYSYEIVVGEDCSTDGTRSILLEYKEKYPDNIKLLLNEKNYGLIKNYFNVLGNCSGEYIMQCAGDDYWLPGKVRTQIEFMENNSDVGMCYSNIQHLYPNKKRSVTKFYKGFRTIDILIKKHDIFAATISLKRNLLLKYIDVIRPLEKKWLMEDYPLCLWFAYNSKLYCMDEVLAVYRHSANSISRPEKYDTMVRFINSVNDVDLFFLNLYEIPYAKKDLENKLCFHYIFHAAKYNQYDEYIFFISKMPLQSIKIFIKKCIGKIPMLFKMLHFYHRLKT